MPENSITITAEQQDAYRLDAELKHHAHSVVGEMIEIGRCLKEINDRKLYELLGCGTLAEYAEAVVAAMSDEEKDEIRREAEKKARTDADKEVERWKNMRDKDAKTYQKAIKEYEADIDAKESEISKLSEKLEAANAENEKLHADAKKASPPPAGNKELLKFHFEALKSAYIGAVEVLERFDVNEREKYKTALIKISEDIRAAAEKM